MTCGHEWGAQGSAGFKSRRTAGCDRCARSKAGRSRLLGIGNLDSFANNQSQEMRILSSAKLRQHKSIAL